MYKYSSSLIAQEMNIALNNLSGKILAIQLQLNMYKIQRRMSEIDLRSAIN